MTTVVFGIEIYIHKIDFTNVSSFPSLNVIIENKDPTTILPYSKEVHPGTVWTIGNVYQLIYIIDAFENCNSCPITFELVSPVETTAIGKCTLELKPLICDSIAAHGYSPIASQTTSFRDFERREVASITFDIRTVLFQMCLRTAAKVISEVSDISKSKHYHFTGKSTSISDYNADDYPSSIKPFSSYKNIPNYSKKTNINTKPDEKRKQVLVDRKAGTTNSHRRRRSSTSKLSHIGNSYD